MLDVMLLIALTASIAAGYGLGIPSLQWLLRLALWRIALAMHPLPVLGQHRTCHQRGGRVIDNPVLWPLTLRIIQSKSPPEPPWVLQPE